MTKSNWVCKYNDGITTYTETFYYQTLEEAKERFFTYALFDGFESSQEYFLSQSTFNQIEDDNQTLLF